MNANAVCRLGLYGAGELRAPDPLTDTPLEGEPMTKAYEIAQQRRAYAAFVQDLKDSGVWDRMSGMMYPGPDGPLNKADLEQIWREEMIAEVQYRIGPAGDLAELVKPRATAPVNLTLDLYEITEHAQQYMLNLGITYELAVPQSIADCWWFFNCRNVPDPLPSALRPLRGTPSSKVGYGLSKEEAERLERNART